MSDSALAFIGGGNMAKALIGGLLARGYPPDRITVSDLSSAQRAELQHDFPGVGVVDDNLAAARNGDTWVLAVKPQSMREVAIGLAPALTLRQPLVISVAAGIRVDSLARWLGGGAPVVRAMPNRPALQGVGVTGLFASATVGAAARTRAENILRAVGATVWVTDEAAMDAVTAVSGSGPAYVFLLIELMEAAGISEGLDPATAHTLAVETAYGASLMARDMPDAPAVLREQVTSKGGTTEAALKVMRAAGLDGIVLRAIHAARTRSAELAAQFGD
jgi:pyrroline-5-carboxylate reductase